MSLQITLFPLNGGRVTTNPPIGPDGTYPEGQKVTVTARPNTGYEFVRGSGVSQEGCATMDEFMGSGQNQTVEREA